MFNKEAFGLSWLNKDKLNWYEGKKHDKFKKLLKNHFAYFLTKLSILVFKIYKVKNDTM